MIKMHRKRYNNIRRIIKLNPFSRCYCEFFPTTSVRIIRSKNIELEGNLKKDSEKVPNDNVAKVNKNNDSADYRVNEVNIQMVSKNIYEQLFKKPSPPVDPAIIKNCQDKLRKHGINYENCEHLPDVKLKLPKLEGEDLVEHFQNIGEQFCAPYKDLLTKLSLATLPPIPKKWSKKLGWHKYVVGRPPEPVPYPDSDALVFDVEVLMSAGKRPTLACAASPDAWYGWVSEPVAKNAKQETYHEVTYESLIPLETDHLNTGDVTRPRLVVGHNVSYDRAKVKEQYWLEKTGLRFMDTMSMHTCVSGVTSYQRAILKSKDKEPSPADEDWIDISSLNSLTEVHKLYCGKAINKQTRDVFVEGTIVDVHQNFQELMTYCAGDVVATANVLKNLLPLFYERFPHPVTLAGMLELGSAYLPVNSNWLQYIDSAETVFEDCKLETRQLLSLKADESCRLMINEEYKNDMWMWDQDWSTQTLKLKKAKVKKKTVPENKKTIPDINKEVCKETVDERKDYQYLDNEYIEHVAAKNKLFTKPVQTKEDLYSKFAHLYDLAELLPVKRPFLPGYPAWYRKLCTKPEKDTEWAPGANNISTSMQITPKLLRLTWEGYPLHHTKEEKWGFLIPFTRQRPASYTDDGSPQIPLDRLLQMCPIKEGMKESSDVYGMEKLESKVEADMGRRTYYARRKVDEKASEYKYHGLGVWSGIQLQGCCHFLRLPHKDGPKNKVGNPLAKDFLDMFSQNVLCAQGNEAEKVLNFGRMMTYWRNNRERIMGQQVVWLPKELLPERLRGDLRRYGAILPQVVVCGTLTRRASEPTWMTASNAHEERIGSELRAMVQSPPGYNFVGADVDSQELWIASLLGDSSLGLIGGTALGWAVLAGSKQNGTDLHSLTARAADLSRDHAKVINYARIYGAGQNFAERLLKQFNPSMSNAEAKSKAIKMYTTTKGRRVYKLKKQYMEGFLDEDLEEQSVEMTSYQAMRLAKMSGKKVEDMFERPKWVGGTESEMFNKLEEIADSDSPRTAFLSGRLSRALEQSSGRWEGTRHNWCVQSAAADFLHLMVISMTHLCPEARFCLSFHDEVRYLVPEEKKYEAALALQITNLLTRAFCSQRVGMNDLPLSVSFFTHVEVDQALRKESSHSCITPSNPRGLKRGYGIPTAKPLDIATLLEYTSQC